MTIPSLGSSLLRVTRTTQPSRTYRIDDVSHRVVGIIDGITAVRQAMLKILNTERYSRVIYSGEYGVELERFIGKDYSFVSADLQRVLLEAVMSDDRISGVTDFAITPLSKDSVLVSVRIQTVEGIVDINTEVTV